MTSCNGKKKLGKLTAIVPVQRLAGSAPGQESGRTDEEHGLRAGERGELISNISSEQKEPAEEHGLRAGERGELISNITSEQKEPAEEHDPKTGDREK